MIIFRVKTSYLYSQLTISARVVIKVESWINNESET